MPGVESLSSRRRGDGLFSLEDRFVVMGCEPRSKCAEDFAAPWAQLVERRLGVVTRATVGTEVVGDNVVAANHGPTHTAIRPACRCVPRLHAVNRFEVVSGARFF